MQTTPSLAPPPALEVVLQRFLITTAWTKDVVTREETVEEEKEEDSLVRSSEVLCALVDISRYTRSPCVVATGQRDGTEGVVATPDASSVVEALRSSGPLQSLFSASHRTQHCRTDDSEHEYDDDDDNGSERGNSGDTVQLPPPFIAWGDAFFGWVLYLTTYMAWSRRRGRDGGTWRANVSVAGTVAAATSASSDTADDEADSDAAWGTGRLPHKEESFASYWAAWYGGTTSSTLGSTATRAAPPPPRSPAATSTAPQHDSRQHLPGRAELAERVQPFLSLFSSPQRAWRRPAVLAALCGLADAVWQLQAHNHDPTLHQQRWRKPAAPGAAATSVPRAVVCRCPLCYAAALNDVLAVETLWSLLELRVSVRLADDDDDEEDADVHERRSRRRKRRAPSAAAKASRRRWLRRHVAARVVLYNHALAVCRTAVWNGCTEVLQRTSQVWVFAPQQRLFPSLAGFVSTDTPAPERALRWQSQQQQQQRGRGSSRGVRETCDMVWLAASQPPISRRAFLLTLCCLWLQDEGLFHRGPHTSSSSSASASVQMPFQRDETQLAASLRAFACVFQPPSSSSGNERDKTGGSDVGDATAHVTAVLLLATPFCWLDGGRTFLSWLCERGYVGAVRVLCHDAACAYGVADGSGPGAVPTVPTAVAEQARDPPHRVLFPPSSSSPTGRRGGGDGGSSQAAVASPQPLQQALCSTRRCSYLFCTSSFSNEATALDAAVEVEGCSSALVRLLVLNGASVHALHPRTVHRLLTTVRQSTLPDGSDVESTVHLLSVPREVLEAPPSGDLVAQLRHTLSAAAAANTLATLAGRLWREKVCRHMPPPPPAVDKELNSNGGGGGGTAAAAAAVSKQWQAYWAAHDRVLRLALSALAYDPLHPVARLCLIAVLGRKLLDHRGGGGAVAAAKDRFAPSPPPSLSTSSAGAAASRDAKLYDLVVRRMFEQLTGPIGWPQLRRAVAVRCGLLQADQPRQCRRDRERKAAETCLTTTAATEQSPLPASMSAEALQLMEFYRSVCADKDRVQAALSAADNAATVAPAASTAAAAPRTAGGGMTASIGCEEGHRDTPLYVLVNMDANVVTAPASSVTAWMPKDQLQLVWLRLPPAMDLHATLRQCGGAYGVVEHDMPLQAPVQRGDVVAFRLNELAVRFDAVEIIPAMAPRAHGGRHVELHCVWRRQQGRRHPAAETHCLTALCEWERLARERQRESRALRSRAHHHHSRRSTSSSSSSTSSSLERTEESEEMLRLDWRTSEQLTANDHNSSNGGGDGVVSCVVLHCVPCAPRGQVEGGDFSVQQHHPLEWLEAVAPTPPATPDADSGYGDGEPTRALDASLPRDVIAALLVRRALVQCWAHIVWAGTQPCWLREVEPPSSPPAAGAAAQVWRLTEDEVAAPHKKTLRYAVAEFPLRPRRRQNSATVSASFNGEEEEEDPPGDASAECVYVLRAQPRRATNTLPAREHGDNTEGAQSAVEDLLLQLRSETTEDAEGMTIEGVLPLWGWL